MKQKILESIRVVADYPKEGVLFRDITTLLNNPVAFSMVIEHFKERYSGEQIDFVVGLESRGFIFGAPLAYALGLGFVPIRKKGKLPYAKVSASYDLEYGSDEIEIHIDAFAGIQNARVVLVDDLIATGGTVQSALKLIEKVGGKCVEACFLIDLVEFGGSKEIANSTKVYSLLQF
ncbi:adenine phosphoribosyltransferase [Helicobacter enhydrae]|uniref:Adenine phosphoribosyltransferase n=2 Tax=Helicobacter enhydrae TaxID=222136 RepID=A0A1B1U3X3_9HELI|nr:adenine phosphoribosyltransferase [Helicobacter enhydrae]